MCRNLDWADTFCAKIVACNPRVLQYSVIYYPGIVDMHVFCITKLSTLVLAELLLVVEYQALAEGIATSLRLWLQP